jgi:hypothetical protein
VFHVALLTGTADDPAAQERLAKALGSTVYEARLALAGGFPSIVLTTAEEAKARAIVDALRAAGDDAVFVDPSAIVSSGAMIPLDHFTLDSDGATAGAQFLPYADIQCLLRAIHRSRSASEIRTTERKLSATKMLLATGVSKTVTTTTKEASESREPVLYVFRRSGATPWLLREIGTSYEGLGAARGLTATGNFATTVRLLREHAPHAAYDERLLHAHRALERASLQGTGAHSTVTSSSASGIDTLAHLVAMAMGRR